MSQDITGFNWRQVRIDLAGGVRPGNVFVMTYA